MARSKFREEKIRILMREGYPFKQAVAIAYDMEKKKKGQDGLTTEQGALSGLIDQIKDRRETRQQDRQERRAERRLGRTDIRNFPAEEVLDY